MQVPDPTIGFLKFGSFVLHLFIFHLSDFGGMTIQDPNSRRPKPGHRSQRFLTWSHQIPPGDVVLLFSDFSFFDAFPRENSLPQVSFVTSLRVGSFAVTLRFSSSVGRPARKWQTWSLGRLRAFHSDKNLINCFRCYIHLVLNEPVRTLDTDNNGYLDFTEFLLAMDLVAARLSPSPSLPFAIILILLSTFNHLQSFTRTADEKLLWAFKLYDTDNSGVIDRLEMRNIMEVVTLIWF